MENLPLAVTGSELSVWALFWQAGWVVKLVMVGLLAASIWTWAIVFDKMFAFRRMKASLNRFEEVFGSGQSLEELYRSLSDRNPTGMGAIFVSAMREWKKSFEKGARSPIGLQNRNDWSEANRLKVFLEIPVWLAATYFVHLVGVRLHERKAPAESIEG